MTDIIDQAAELLERDQYASMFELMAKEIERLRADRSDVIEECAKVAEEEGWTIGIGEEAKQLAAAIRALKERP